MQIVPTTLAERVEGAIVANPFFSGRRLRFEAEEGRVILSGSVGTYYHKQMAQEIVRRIEGVREIENCLEVSWLPGEPGSPDSLPGQMMRAR